MILFLDANICLDLLDDTRKNARTSIAFYHTRKDSAQLHMSADFITTIYYVLTQRKKRNNQKVVKAISLLSDVLKPIYLNNSDLVNAKIDFSRGIFEDFEDILILNSALRVKADYFVTNDKALLSLGVYGEMKIVAADGMIEN